MINHQYVFTIECDEKNDLFILDDNAFYKFEENNQLYTCNCSIQSKNVSIILKNEEGKIIHLVSYVVITCIFLS